MDDSQSTLLNRFLERIVDDANRMAVEYKAKHDKNFDMFKKRNRDLKIYLSRQHLQIKNAGLAGTIPETPQKRSGAQRRIQNHITKLEDFIKYTIGLS